MLTPDETRKLNNDQCIVLIRGCDPIIDRKFNTFKHPLFKETEDGGAPPYIHDVSMAQRQENVKFLSEESLKYYEKKKQNGEPVHILELSADELFAANPIPEKIFTDQELEENRNEAGESIKEVRKKSRNIPEKAKPESSQADEEALFKLLAANPYSDEQLEEIRIAIGSGIAYKDIIRIADIGNTAERMKQLRLEFTKDTANP